MTRKQLADGIQSETAGSPLRALRADRTRLVRRLKACLLVLGLLLLLGGVGAGIVVLLRYEPAVYRKCAVAVGPERKKYSGEFISEFNYLYESIRRPHEFSAPFDENRINSFFAEDFVTSGLAQRILPEGVSQPRIAIEPDKIRLAFRYGTGIWSTIVSIDMRVWVPDDHRQNTVCLELQGMHAGAMPISAQALLEQISEAARQQNITVTWYRYNGNPTALLRFQTDQPRPSVRLTKIDLQTGPLVIHGNAADAGSLQAMLPMFSDVFQFAN